MTTFLNILYIIGAFIGFLFFSGFFTGTISRLIGSNFPIALMRPLHVPLAFLLTVIYGTWLFS